MIDSKAIIADSAIIADDVEIGPWTVIGENVTIGAGCKIGPHAVINGRTEIGRNNRIYQFASIGEDPQDKKYAGEDTLLQIGDNNVFREFTTINRGTVQGGDVTRIGNDNLFMAYVHVAHDCIIGNNNIFANATNLAGHIEVDDYVIFGAFCGVHQFCKVGSHSLIAHAAMVPKDVPPYVLISGHSPAPYGINTEGLKRRGYSSDAINALRKAYKIIFRNGLTVQEAVAELEVLAADCEPVNLFIDFLNNRTTRGIVR